MRINFSGAIVGSSTPLSINSNKENMIEFLQNFQEENSEIYNKIFDEDGNIKAFIGMYVNGDRMENVTEDLKLGEADEIDFIGSTAGG